MAHAGGRPYGAFKFDSAEDLQIGIDDFFTECDSKKWPYTMAGLALALNISRKTLVNYSKVDKFFTSVSRARARCEQYAESALYDNKASNGAKFALSNNYDGWRDKQEIDLGNKDGEPFKLDVSEDDIKQRLASLGFTKKE